MDLFAGLPVSDLEHASAWYERFLGSPPTFLPDDTEAVWDLAEHRFLYLDVRPEDAGHGMVTLFVDDLDARVRGIGERGIEPSTVETYDNGVRKVTYRDPDGNELGVGGGPVSGDL
jgi:catechol 2,3-dioxygenase-like lactoylglutathione lyase family enzyme